LKYHDAIRNNKHDQYLGLTFWAPNINIFRDPLWGRGQVLYFDLIFHIFHIYYEKETYGEDPYLTSRMGKSVTRGLQGDNPKYFKAHSCAKHFAVHRF
jgi:beta-glucosidase